MLSVVCHAQTSFQVSSACNIYGAGHDVPPAPAGLGAGVLPVEFALPSNAVFVQVFDVQGQVSYGCVPSCVNNADGATITACGEASWDGISGWQGDRARYLTAVFLGAVEPHDPPPPPLSITEYSFASISPGLQQQCFVGDGLAASGVTQSFIVPAGATRVFLGFADSPEGCGGLPGGYFNNTGSINGTLVVYVCHADFNHDGFVTGDDFDAYVAAFESGC